MRRTNKKIKLLPHETIVKEGQTNCLKCLEGVSGRLYLTNIRLIFESHAFNIQIGVTSIPLSDMVRVEPGWATLLGIPVVPKAIKVITKTKQTHNFVVQPRDEWISAIKSRLR
jgi:hypothetical protein